MSEKLFSNWAIVELMGHVRIAGRVSEEEHFGSKLGRIDIPDPEGDGFTTQFFGGGSVYRLTPCTEEMARVVAKQSQPDPVYAWDLRRQMGLLPKPEPAPTYGEDDEGDDFELERGVSF